MRDVQEILARLVDQFSDPYAFLRELVQNSMDAGASLVEFELEYSGSGVTMLVCRDNGEGMDEALIERRLTRLFASSKEGDLTKVGQFGIGFVSVFALSPDDVVLDTGRSGQSWRVHFLADRTFRKAPLAEPVEGTLIRWLKKQSPSEHGNFAKSCDRALREWCRHAQVSVSFQGSPINEPFAFDHPLAILGGRSGTQVAMRPCFPGQSWTGFYNQGLTLAVLTPPELDGLEVRVSSRYFALTLTRDQICRDENYAKALQVVDELLRGEFLPKLLSTAQKLPAGPMQGYLAAHWDRLSAEQRALPVVPGFGRHYSLAEMAEEIRHNPEWLWSDQSDPLVEALLAGGRKILKWEGKERATGPEHLARKFGVGLIHVNLAYVVATLESPNGGEKIWLKRIHWLLEDCRKRYQEVWLARFPVQAAARAYLVGEHPDQPLPLNGGAASESQHLLLERSHPVWQRLFSLDAKWGVGPACEAVWDVFPQLAPEEQRRSMLLGALRRCPW